MCDLKLHSEFYNNFLSSVSGSPSVGLIVGLVCLALFIGIGVGVLLAVLVFKGYIPRRRNEGKFKSCFCITCTR